MRRNVATVIGAIIVIAIVAEVLSSKQTPKVLTKLSKVFTGAVQSVVNPKGTSSAGLQAQGNKNISNAAYVSAVTGASDYLPVEAAWIVGGGGGGATATATVAPMTPSPNNAPNATPPGTVPKSPGPQSGGSLPPGWSTN